MVISLRRLWMWCKMLILFLICTFLLYQIIHWLMPLVYPEQWKPTPGDGAIKVFSQTPLAADSGIQEWKPMNFTDRLILFYWMHE